MESCYSAVLKEDIRTPYGIQILRYEDKPFASFVRVRTIAKSLVEPSLPEEHIHGKFL